MDKDFVAALPWASLLPHLASSSSSGNGGKGKTSAAVFVSTPSPAAPPAAAAAPAPPGFTTTSPFKADSKPATLTKASSLQLPPGLTPEQVELILDGKAPPPPGVSAEAIAEAKMKRQSGQSGDKDGKCALN